MTLPDPYRAIFEHAVDYAFVVTDRGGRITHWSPGATRILGWTAAEAIGHGAALFFTPEDRADDVPGREMSTALACGRAMDERWHLRADGGRFWASGELMVLPDEAGVPRGFVKILRDQTARRQDLDRLRRAEEEQRFLRDELSHRLKNTLAMVQAIVSQTLRATPDIETAKDVLAARLVALGKAHDVLVTGEGQGATMRDVVDNALAIHLDGARRLVLDGPDLPVGAAPALSLTLILHELATNAVKYGALSVPGGRVAVTWTVDDTADGPVVTVSWTESGGPAVTPPSRRGFGSRLIQRGLAGVVGGEVILDYRSEGLTCRMTAPLAGFR